MTRVDRIADAARRRVNKVWEPLVLGVKTMGARDGYVCRNILGSKMLLDVNDPGICRELLLSGVREEWGTEVLRGLLRPGQTIVDIGANICYYALFEASVVGPAGKVYAIEPVPANYDLLCRNVELNGYRNTETFQCGIGDRVGKAQMHISHLRNWHSMTDVHATGRVIDVDLITLDAFLDGKRCPSIIRMDVEGFEYEILNGMTKTLADAHKLTLYIEIHPHLMGREKTIAMLMTLASNGYGISRIAGRRREERYSIETLMQDDAAMSGQRGGFLVFFSR